MLHVSPHQQPPVHADKARPCDELEFLRAEVVHLRRENRRLRAALDAHVARAGSQSLYGPLELTAGTSVVPRRQD